MRRWLIVLALAALVATAGCLGSGSSSAEPQADDQAQPEPQPDPEEPEPSWPPIEQASIRPGVNVVDGACTSNFLFATPDNATLFLGTAAHCVDDKEIGDPVTVAAGAAEGTLAYSSFHTMNETGDDIAANDFALIELPDEARDRVHPAMLTFGGPTEISAEVGVGDKLYAHGNSTMRPGQTPEEAGPREGYVTHHDEWETGMYFAGPGIPGDSGSAVTTADGAALGTLVTLEIAPQPASNNVANLAATLAYANEHMDRTVELVTWATQGEGQLPDQAAPGTATLTSP